MSWLGFLPETAQGAAALHLPNWLRFECTSCGRCCDSGWTVSVTPVIAAGIESSEAAAGVLREGYQPLRVSEDGQRRLLGKRSDQTCVFLGSENLCHLHAEVGGTRKPLVCQVYPFDLTETPNGYYAAVSFACPAVLAGVGPSVEEQRQSLQMLLRTHGRAVPKRGQLAERVGWTHDLSGSWWEYLEWEEGLLEQLSRRPAVDLLLEAAWGIAERAQRSAPWSASPSPLLDPIREELEAVVFDSTLSILAAHETPEDLDAQREFGTRLRYASPADLTALELPIAGLFLRGGLSLVEEETLQRYAVSHVFGKRLLRGSLLEGVLALLCALSLLRSLLKALSERRGRPEPSFEDLDTAFRFVETEVLTHTQRCSPLFAECEQRFLQVVSGAARAVDPS